MNITREYLIKFRAAFRPELRKLISMGLFGCLLFSSMSVMAQEEFEIRLEEGFVWLESDQADLVQLLRNLSIAGGFRLWISDEFEAQPVTLTVSKQSMTETLRRLLEGHAHALVHSDNATVTGLYVMHSGQSQGEGELPSPGDDTLRRQALQETLKNSLLPETFQVEILNQLTGSAPPVSESPGPQPVLIQQSPELEQIIEQLKQLGSSIPGENPQLNEIIQNFQGKE